MDNLILNDHYYLLNSITPFFYPETIETPLKKGKAVISTYKFEDKKNPLFNLRAIRDGGTAFRVRDGHYTRLHLIDDEGKYHLVMSDTGLERDSNWEFVFRVNGRVLIAGLGLGLIIHNLLTRNPKWEKPDFPITEIVIIEKYQDVIDLVSPKYNDSRIKTICADIFDWKPVKNDLFDTIYFDIWGDINTDNLDDIRRLHNRFKNHVNRNNPHHYMDSWMKNYLQIRKKHERYYGW